MTTLHPRDIWNAPSCAFVSVSGDIAFSPEKNWLLNWTHKRCLTKRWELKRRNISVTLSPITPPHGSHWGQLSIRLLFSIIISRNTRHDHDHFSQHIILIITRVIAEIREDFKILVMVTNQKNRQPPLFMIYAGHLVIAPRHPLTSGPRPTNIRITFVAWNNLRSWGRILQVLYLFNRAARGAPTTNPFCRGTWQDPGGWN